jgi:hypothetical protein
MEFNYSLRKQLMPKSTLPLLAKSCLALPILSCVFSEQFAIAQSPGNQAIDNVEPSEIKISTQGQQVCAIHPQVTQMFCTDLEALLQIKKGLPMIDPADLNQEAALMNVTDAESDAAIAMFGCDCIVSINRLRHVRNSFS